MLIYKVRTIHPLPWENFGFALMIYIAFIANKRNYPRGVKIGILVKNATSEISRKLGFRE